MNRRIVQVADKRLPFQFSSVSVLLYFFRDNEAIKEKEGVREVRMALRSSSRLFDLFQARLQPQK